MKLIWGLLSPRVLSARPRTSQLSLRCGCEEHNVRNITRKLRSNVFALYQVNLHLRFNALFLLDTCLSVLIECKEQCASPFQESMQSILKSLYSKIYIYICQHQTLLQKPRTQFSLNSWEVAAGET